MITYKPILGVKNIPGRVYLGQKALGKSERNLLIDTVYNEAFNLPTANQKVVLLTTSSIRARLQRELSIELPNSTVLSYQELGPDLNIQPIGRISWDM